MLLSSSAAMVPFSIVVPHSNRDASSSEGGVVEGFSKLFTCSDSSEIYESNLTGQLGKFSHTADSIGLTLFDCPGTLRL